MAWNIDVVCNTDELKLGTIQAKMMSIKADDIKAKFRIVSKDKNGLITNYRTTKDGEIVSTKKNWVNEKGEIVDKSEIKYFRVLDDGTEEEVSPYDMTKTLEIQKFTDKNTKDLLLVEKKCEIFNKSDKEKVEVARNSTKQLLELANYLQNSNKVALSYFSFGRGFKRYLAVLSPVFFGDRFVLEMSLAQKKTEFKNLMPIQISVSDSKPKAKKLEIAIEV